MLLAGFDLLNFVASQLLSTEDIMSCGTTQYFNVE